MNAATMTRALEAPDGKGLVEQDKEGTGGRPKECVRGSAQRSVWTTTCRSATAEEEALFERLASLDPRGKTDDHVHAARFTATSVRGADAEVHVLKRWQARPGGRRDDGVGRGLENWGGRTSNRCRQD